MAAIQNRYDFVYLFDVQDGNPNGDPDAGNLPRVDAETGRGLVTDVCLKRKVRNYIGVTQKEQPPYEIYVKEKAILNLTHQRAYKAIGAEDELKGEKGKRKGSGDTVSKARKWMCENFFDVRTFGAVMSTGVNCGQVRGPIQLTFSRSVHPVISQEHAITRMAVATEEEAAKQQGDNRTMGRKFTIPYGLYRGHGFISAHLAADTGFSEKDLNHFWEALKGMFDLDRSAARGLMAARKLIVFKHESALGNAPAHQLFERVKVERSNGNETPPRSFSDYTVMVNKSNLPQGITVLELL